MSKPQGPFWSLYEELKAGAVTRREFIARASALGVGFPVIVFVLNALNMKSAAAQDATPGATPGAGATPAAAGRPSVGSEGLTRGSLGELKLLQWQAPTVLSTHKSNGTKDQLASSLVSEPLMSYLPDGTLIPTLAAEVPSIGNGVAEDLTSVTYKLKPGVLWSDGTPFTANDVKFTHDWIADPVNGAVFRTVYAVIDHVDVIDDLTVKLTFTAPQLAWYVPFSGTFDGVVVPKHILEGGPEKHDAFTKNPIGTGPYIVESFTPGDQVVYTANPNFRDPNRPFFAKVNLKGGGEATDAARAVLQTGDWDFAWNVQVEPKLLKQMQTDGGKGTVQTTSPVSVERLLINFSDPNKEVDGQRSEINTPHPFWSDPEVRKAFSLATDRATIANQFYLGGDLEPPAVNILTGISTFESKNTSYKFDLDAANATLDAAGWTKNGDVREKNGVQLKIVYSTTINKVRQNTQQLNKQNWEKAGFKVQMKQVDAGTFFDSNAGNEQNAQHFYVDVLMYTNNPTDAHPLQYFASWYGGTAVAGDATKPQWWNVSQKWNGWSGANESRYHSAEFDALYDANAKETDPQKSAELFIQMNDHIINNIVVVPEVARATDEYAISNTLHNENVVGSFLEVLYWNIANWTRVAGA
jgi:peptide/nickel transport system substrate-binding protein